jgi:hypothetical protein
VADQKQEVSWASSRHWLTSRVLFLPDLDKYGAVLDNTTVALWDAGDTLLANIKKYKVPLIKHRLTPLLPNSSLSTNPATSP